MRNRYLLLGASCAAISGGGQAAAQSPAVATAAEAERVTELEDVVVTASRRSESLRDVPTAVSAFSEERLRDTQIASLKDLVAMTPNVQISSYATNANINIRGVGNGSFNHVGGDPGVAVHQNGVYLGQPGLALSTFLDVRQVEILRGPQGTLFGRNATGGAINIIPNVPTETLAYGVDLSGGIDPARVRSAAYLSGPLGASGEWLGRLSVAQNYSRGYTRNGVPGGPSRLDGNDDVAFRGQLEWRPRDEFSLLLATEYQRNRDAGPAAFLLGTPNAGPVVFPDPLNPVVLPPRFPRGDPDGRTAYANVGARDTETKSATLIGAWSVGGGDLKATLSHQQSSNSIAQDGDGTAIPFTATYFNVRGKQQYAELIYASDASKPLSYVVGANYFHEDVSQSDLIPTSGYVTLFPVYFARGAVDTESYALFGHAKYALSSSTTIFGGVRYSHDRKDMTEFFNLNPILVGRPADNADSRSWSEVSYEFGVSSEFSETITGYAKYATGYKSGGYSVTAFNPAFEPETNANIEAGLKGSFAEGRLQANLAAFHMTYDDLQVLQIQGLASAVRNAAKATVDGFEFEAIVRPTGNLRIEFSGSWLRARFDEFFTQDSARPQLGTLDLEGNTLPGSPRFTASLGVFNDIPLSQGTLTLGGRFDWRSRLYFSEFNLPISAQDAVGKLDLFVNFKSADARWTASLFVLNATDRAVKSNVLVVSALLGSLALGQYEPPRRAGLSVGYHF